MVDIVETMDTRERILATLKRRGATTVPELQDAVEVSENTVRHHLTRLRSEGLVEERAGEPSGPGRPAQQYALTATAEGEFPKRYAELLELVLAEAEASGAIGPILQAVARRLGALVRPELAHLSPEARLEALMVRLDFGDMLGRMERTEGGWEFRAYNCVYRDAGMRFVEVCELLPQIVQEATGLPCERVICQRAGNRSCVFAGSFTPDRA
jgi:predicted ArsR family transcriptional regulator